MTPLEFLQTVWPDEGLYCLAIPFGSAWKHKVFKTIDEAAAMCEQLKTTNNMYFTIHTLKDWRVWNPRHHKDRATGQYIGDYSVRLQANTLCAKALFLDLDVGISKPDENPKYVSQADAVKDLKNFVNATGLPKPMVVSSGHGVHVYWLLSEKLNSADAWLTQATRLRQLAAHYQLRYDPRRTTDRASVLRVAGTFNLKKGGQRPVEVLMAGDVIEPDQFAEILVDALEAVDEIVAPPKSSVLDDLGSNLRSEFQAEPPSMRALLTACGQIRRLVKANGCSPEPEWYAGDIGVINYTVNGRANVHKVSSGYSGYSYAETDAKIDQWVAKTNDNPASCLHLMNECGPRNAQICKSCWYYKQNGNPILAARLKEDNPAPIVKPLNLSGIVVDDEIQIPKTPGGYTITDKGVHLKIEPKKDGDKEFLVNIYPYELRPILRRVNAERETEQHLWRVHLPHEGVKDFTVEASTFVDDRALTTRLANIGVYPPKFPEVKAYMSAYIRELQSRNPIRQQYNELGWHAEFGEFVLGEKLFRSDGKVLSAALSKECAEAKDFIKTKGSLERQVELLHFYDDPKYIPHQFMIMCSLGSVLFNATEQHGVVVNATGISGASKSTALEVAAGFWGSPKQYIMNCTGDGWTPLRRTSRRTTLCNLPACADEISHMKPDEATTLAMGSTQATGRKIMHRDGTAKTGDVSERSSISITTSNTSIHGLLQQNTAGHAAAMRVLELNLKRQNVHEDWEADEFLSEIRQNYGWIGEQFIKYVVENWEKVQQRVRAYNKALRIKAKSRQDERFWFAAVASAVIACGIARELGLVTWSPIAIQDWFLKEQLPTMRGTVLEETQAASPIVTLMTYLNQIHGDTIRVTDSGSPTGPNTPHVPNGKLLAHHDLDKKFIWVLKDGFRLWCEKRGQYSQGILKELQRLGVVPILTAPRTLGAGTIHAKGRSMVFVVNLDHPAVADAAPKLAGSAPLKAVR